LSEFIHEQSQYGEVELLIRLMVNHGPRQKIVVDVGANGVERSNSYDFLRHFGWRGLLIEPNPALIEGIRSGFAGTAMDVVECAVSDYDGVASLHFGVNADISSLDREATAGWGEVSGSVEVKVRRLGAILAEHRIPLDFDLLSLDIEGHDIRVLNDLIGNTRYRPQHVIIEASYERTVDSFEKLEALGLSPVARHLYRFAGQTHANIILERTVLAPAS